MACVVPDRGVGNIAPGARVQLFLACAVPGRGICDRDPDARFWIWVACAVHARGVGNIGPRESERSRAGRKPVRSATFLAGPPRASLVRAFTRFINSSP